LIIDLVVWLGFDGFRKKTLKLDLESHGMSTALMGDEKLAVAVELTIIKCYMVTVVIAMKGNIKLVQEETILLFCIAFCLFSLSDHSIVHV
jgi:hypothetical protein